MMFRTLVVAAIVAIGAGTAIAQSDPIAQRKALMKDVGAATRVGSQMVKGDAPFDLAKAKSVLASYAKAASGMHELFPENSRTGGETSASPKVWEDSKAFRAKFDAWGAQIEKASAATTDLESFKASFGAVTKACGDCHETYRISKS